MTAPVAKVAARDMADVFFARQLAGLRRPVVLKVFKRELTADRDGLALVEEAGMLRAARPPARCSGRPRPMA